jgi:hypothetical protein
MMLMFTPVKHWEELYEVSKDAVIKSIPRYGTRREGTILSHSTDSDGYNVVKFRNKSIVKTMKVHRLVATTFIPNPDNKPQVNHKDGNKKNNNVSNLEWVTASENIRHAKTMGLQCECPNRQRVEQLEDGLVINVFPSLKEAEKQTGIGWTGISAVTRGIRKTAGGYYWRRCND